MVVFVIWYSLQRIVNRHRFLKYTQILRNPTTSEGCKNFSRGLGYTLWVFRRSAWIRAFERTYFHDHLMRRSKNFGEKLIFVQKNLVSDTFLNLTFLTSLILLSIHSVFADTGSVLHNILYPQLMSNGHGTRFTWTSTVTSSHIMLFQVMSSDFCKCLRFSLPF